MQFGFNWPAKTPRQAAWAAFIAGGGSTRQFSASESRSWSLGGSAEGLTLARRCPERASVRLRSGRAHRGMGVVRAGCRCGSPRAQHPPCSDDRRDLPSALARPLPPCIRAQSLCRRARRVCRGHRRADGLGRAKDGLMRIGFVRVRNGLAGAGKRGTSNSVSERRFDASLPADRPESPPSPVCSRSESTLSASSPRPGAARSGRPSSRCRSEASSESSKSGSQAPCSDRSDG
jgi:hypothetical protein